MQGIQYRRDNAIKKFEILHLPKQHDKTVHFDTHADQGPTQKNGENPSKEGSGAFPFVFLEEKTECALQTHHKGQPSQEEDLKNARYT